jgi:MoaA/NifB/PqqE/SkfB family radical SAM enzyme
MPYCKVIGIAGPGEPLANEETFETLRLVKDEFSDLILCLSTNGLLLPERVDDILNAGVKFLTVTVNAVDPEVAKRIYGYVVTDRVLRGLEAAQTLIAKQQAGIEMIAKTGVIVKVNTVVCPGINDYHVPKIAEHLRDFASFMNLMPLIPVEGTPFSHITPPDPNTLNKLRELCEAHIPQIRHCRQCRSDSIGFLGGSWHTVSELLKGKEQRANLDYIPIRVAVASTDGVYIDEQFGLTDTFWIYDVTPKSFRLVEKRNVRQYCFGKISSSSINDVIGKLRDCQLVICKHIGHKPRQELLAVGVEPQDFSGTIPEAIEKVVRERFGQFVREAVS